MVVFLCSSCNESLRKNVVEKHFYHCRGCKTVSCMDCHTDFNKTSFKSHTSCITEKEKYDKLRASEITNGSKKQQQWTAFVQEVLNRTIIQDPSICQVMRDLQSSENLPRKKPKFQNFMKSKYRRLRPDQVDQIWEILSTARSKDESNVVPVPPTKKRALDCENSNNSVIETATPSFSFTKTARRLLKEANGTLSLTKLNAKIYSVYKTSAPCSHSQLPLQEFKEQLLNVIESKKSFSHSKDDDMVHLLPKETTNTSRDVDLDQETPNHIDSSGTKDELVVGGSAEGTLSERVVDILQENEGQLRFKKLLKQLFNTFSNDTTITMEKLQHRLEKRLKKANHFTLSEDGKFVVLIHNGT